VRGDKGPVVSAENGGADVGTTVRVPKMAELVAHSLRRQIVQGELSEGDPLPSETELMRQFGVSRPTLREALRVLESENLINVKRGAHGGARIMAPSSDVAAQQAALLLQHRGVTLLDVYRARELVEPAVVRQLAVKRTAAQVKALRARLADEKQDLDRREPHVDASHSFHHLVIELAGNQTVALLLAMLDRIIEQATLTKVANTPPSVSNKAFMQGLAVHEQLVDLIEAQDPAGAEHLWAEHLHETSNYLTRGSSARKVLDLFG